MAALVSTSLTLTTTPVDAQVLAVDDQAGMTEPGPSVARLRAEIRRTEFGIPHIEADDWPSLGYGYGYAFAEDNICLLAEMVATANAERSRWFGADDANLRQDLFHQQLIDLGIVESTLAAGPDAAVPGPTRRVRDLVAGTAMGVNRYLRQVGGSAGIEDPRCADAEWVRPVSELDLWHTYLGSAVRAGRGALLGPVVTAQPPGTPAVADASAADVLPPVADSELGSNAYGFGRQVTASGGGMLLANPHFPWDGSERFYQMHLTIPGEYDVIGAGLAGQPVVEIGHNATMGWSHTVSTARRFTLHELRLVPGNPTQYYVDGEVRDMTAQVVEVEVADADGDLSTVSRTLWSSEYGPIVVVEPLAWTTTRAYALRDVNQDTSGRLLDGFIEMGKASSTRSLQSVLDTWQHLPWVNTVAADSSGEVFYGDHSAVPNVPDDHLDDCLTSIGRVALDQFGVFVLDGSDSGCAWRTDADARIPGIMGPSRLPAIVRSDYVANSNDSHWLANPDEPLVGFDRILGAEGTERSLRTRLGIRQIQERLAGTDGREGTSFTLEQLQDIQFSNRLLGAELIRDDLVSLCRARPLADIDGYGVDLMEACEVLADWDLRAGVDSRGAHLFRQFVVAGGLRWSVPFDPADPVGTPHTLDVGDPAVLRALGVAVKQLVDADIPLDARLGDLQQEKRFDRMIPIHGGTGAEGAFNVVNAPFDDHTGYPDVRSGTSFVLAAEFTSAGPRSRAILAYSNSSDPTSPHFADQTERYSRGEWIDLDFRDADIAADPELEVVQIEEGLPASEISIDDVCRAVVDLRPFDDVTDPTFEPHIACLSFAGITRGQGPGSPDDPRPGFAPGQTVTREAMASFVARTWERADALDVGDQVRPLPPAPSADPFTDLDDGSVHRENVLRLSAAGVVLGGPAGRPPSEFGPALSVTRGQMASFISRALEVMLGTDLTVDDDYFHDDIGSVHERSINAVADAGIAVGVAPGRFDPHAVVTRDQMAAFLTRSLASLELYDVITPFAPPTPRAAGDRPTSPLAVGPTTDGALTGSSPG